MGRNVVFLTVMGIGVKSGVVVRQDTGVRMASGITICFSTLFNRDKCVTTRGTLIPVT